MREIKTFTNEELETNAQKVREHKKYGIENFLIDGALKQHPENKDLSIVAMKIALIDLTNSTNLSKLLGREDGLYKLAEKIIEVDFDERVKNGDLSLVEELSRWTKENIGKNLFSFISKYCLYHNLHCHNRDDYVIYDSVVGINLYDYISDEDYYKLSGRKLTKRSIAKLRNEYNYELFSKIADYILKENNITVDNAHRKLDWYIWYKNK